MSGCKMSRTRNKEVTSPRAASAASKVMRNPNSSKDAKSAAGSALSQTRAPTKVTRAPAATAAAKTLQRGGANKASKTAAGSALTQRPDRRK